MLPGRPVLILSRRHICATQPVAFPLQRSPLYKRRLHIEGLALAPVVFGGLLLSLWTWKCLMMVVFQNKIIYMPGLPPNSRWEKISDYKHRLGGISWREERVRATDGTNLALCVADLEVGVNGGPCSPGTPFYILYFQGNASSIPPRLPDLSATLNMLRREMAVEQKSARCTIVCLSYRGYWTSRGRPTENGLRLDSNAAIEWISRMHQEASNEDPRNLQTPAQIVLWGQSIGSGVATNLAAEKCMPENLRLNSLILETPFTSIRAMLEVLYPQKWLPYRHLWPFLRNHLDSWKNFKLVADIYSTKAFTPEILIVQAAKDELVPAELSQMLYDRCVQLQLPISKVSVAGAFHNDAMFRAEGRRAVSQFLARKIRDAQK
ncbi:putative alpha beta superfamily hydrolase [Rosellinia necatrix]|uniref:Putative alpha beta superfamily hydrolase n=1 Tax=Rosellinia necatrix TaxID=77044 RepID=A0A1W2TBR9_ROSNE|nr:putative alpha beta superfamily hydrolase [Rosellinia necatrix]